MIDFKHNFDLHGIFMKLDDLAAEYPKNSKDRDAIRLAAYGLYYSIKKDHFLDFMKYVLEQEKEFKPDR